MKRFAAALVLLAAMGGMAVAQDAFYGADNGYENEISFNFAAQLSGFFYDPMALILEVDYQHAFGQVGLDACIGYAGLIQGIDNYVKVLTFELGPVFYFSGPGVSGFWLRARAAAAYAFNFTSSAIGFGGDAHIGYAWVIELPMGVVYYVSPYIGVMYLGKPSFSFGFNWGNAF